jgi:KDO2-lipid IV(A) lauroyltransferase
MRRQRPLVDWFVYIAIRFAAMIFQMFPVNWNLITARMLTHVWCWITPRHLNRARGHLRLAYGDSWSEARINHVAFQSLQQMCMMAMEFFFTSRLINEISWYRYIRLHNIDKALEHLLTGRGAILVTGHYGSWELMGYTLSAFGFPLRAVMRPLDNPHLNRFLLEGRARRGLRLINKQGAAESAGPILEQGGLIGFIADQNAGRKGEFVDFFGTKASTYKSIALLAMLHEVPIIVGYARRISDRFEYEVGSNRIIEPHEWKDRPDPVHWITQEYTRAIEQFVREVPEQYLWIHRRWKSRPRNEKQPPALPR